MSKLSAKIAIQLHLDAEELSPPEQQDRIEKLLVLLEGFLHQQLPGRNNVVCRLLRVSEEPRGPFCVAACLSLQTLISGTRRPRGVTATRACTLAGWLRTLEGAGVKTSDTETVSIFTDDLSLDYRITLQQAFDTGWRWGADDEAHWEGLARGVLISMDPGALCANQIPGRRLPEERRTVVRSVASRIRELYQAYRNGETPAADGGACPLTEDCPQWQELRLRSKSAEPEKKECDDVEFLKPSLYPKNQSS